MKSKKATKRALLSSALSLVLCFSMLLGTTFAWFTDSASTAVNTIKSGTLDVDLVDKDDATLVGQTLEFVPAEETEQILWEPGCTFVSEGFKVVNKGNLALKYKLAITGINGDAELLDVIEFWLVESKPDADNWNTLPKFQLDKENNLDPNGKTLINGGKYQSELYYLVGHMNEDAGNEYQDKILDGVGITVYATQVEAEVDSFDENYDADATYKPDYWNGIVPTEMPEETLVVDGATQTIHVRDAAAFAYLSTLSAEWAELYTDGNGTDYSNYANGAGADYYYSSKWTVSLETDIDLNNKPIEPIVLVFGESTGDSAFKGNNHVIRNINTTTGLFANDNRISYSDLVLENVKATNGALTGVSRTSISNVTVKNATISGTDYVGGLVGYIYGTVSGCKVENSSVKASGKEAGGLIGFIDSSSGDGKVTENEVRNVSVFANNRAAGLVAQANVGVKVYNNTVDTVTVLAEDVSKYQPGAVISNAIVPENVYDNTVTDCTTAVLETISSPAELTSVLSAAGAAGAGDSYISITEDLDMTDVDWTPISVDGYHGADVVTIYGNGATITGLTAPLFAGGFAGGSGIIIKDLTIADSNIVSTSGLGGGAFVDTADSMQVITLENCHLINSTVSGERTGGLIGWCSGYAKLDDGPVKAYVTISDCSVVDSTVTGAGSAGAIAGHPGASDYTYTTIEDCVVKNVKVISNDDGEWRTGAIVGTANNGHIVINNVTVEDVTLTQNGVTATETKLYGRFVPSGTGTLVIDGVAVVAP